jgi:CRISPR system CASCADE complex protein casC
MNDVGAFYSIASFVKGKTMSVFVDIHVLQTLPPSNPNRDDTGAPKSATFGGVQRMRISSQAIKRATRQDFEGKLADGNYGVRTKKIVELVARTITEKRPDLEAESIELAEMGLKAIGFKLTEPRGDKSNKELKEAGFLVFLSAKQIEHVADALISVACEDDPAAAFKELKPRSLVDTNHSIDIALFGRMVAEPNALNVDAACQVAHAIGVGAVEHEYDYYTAVDDEKKRNDEADEGAGMIGTIEFASATVYRYATINVDLLRENLGDDAVADRAVELFVDSFVRSMPTGKVTTFANRTLPDAVLVQIRDDQPINMSGAFEEPIVAGQRGFAEPAIKRFVEFEARLRELTGLEAVESLVSWTTPRGESFSELGKQVRLASLGETAVEAVRGTR